MTVDPFPVVVGRDRRSGQLSIRLGRRGCIVPRGRAYKFAERDGWRPRIARRHHHCGHQQTRRHSKIAKQCDSVILSQGFVLSRIPR